MILISSDPILLTISLSLLVADGASHLVDLHEVPADQSFQCLVYLLESGLEGSDLVVDELGNFGLGNGLALLHYPDDASLDDDGIVPLR